MCRKGKFKVRTKLLLRTKTTLKTMARGTSKEDYVTFSKS